jgi:hypothetical protein
MWRVAYQSAKYRQTPVKKREVGTEALTSFFIDSTSVRCAENLPLL